MSPFAERLTPVSNRLDTLRRSIRALFALDGFSRLFLALAAFIAATFVIDWSLALPSAVRWVILTAGVGGFAWIAVRRIVSPLRVGVTDDDLALFVERQYPELNDRLISAIQLAREADKTENSPELVDLLIKDAEQAAAAVDFNHVVVRKHVGQLAAWAGGAVLFLAGLGLWNPDDCASIYFNRVLGGARKWPQRTHLRVLDFTDRKRVIARGDDLPIVVEVFKGVVPQKVTLEYRFLTGETGTERLTQVEPRRFLCPFTRITGPFEFVVKGGDDVLEPHAVDTLNPPGIEATGFFYEYPAYMHLKNTPSDRPETAGNVVAPIGTKVRFEAQANEDLQAAVMTLGTKAKDNIRNENVTIEPAVGGRPRRIVGSFPVDEPYSEFILEMTAKNGLKNRDPIRFTIKGLEDRKPEILVKEPVQDTEDVTDMCKRPLEIEVRDDYGVAHVYLEHVVIPVNGKPGEWQVREYDREQLGGYAYGQTMLRAADVLDISRMKLAVGDHVEIRWRAEDFKDVGSPNVTRSKSYKFLIVTVAALEKKLQDDIEKIKAELKKQKGRQESAYTSTGGLIGKFGKGDALSQEQMGEIRQKGMDQKDIASRLDSARRDIRYVKRRGVYNGIYDETAAATLQHAIDELDLLVGDPNDAAKPGIALVAAAFLDDSARMKVGAERGAVLHDAQNLQNSAAAGIQRAIDHLDKWSSYQEMVRLWRELHDAQKGVLDGMKKGGK